MLPGPLFHLQESLFSAAVVLLASVVATATPTSTQSVSSMYSILKAASLSLKDFSSKMSSALGESAPLAGGGALPFDISAGGAFTGGDFTAGGAFMGRSGDENFSTQSLCIILGGGGAGVGSSTQLLGAPGGGGGTSRGFGMTAGIAFEGNPDLPTVPGYDPFLNCSPWLLSALMPVVEAHIASKSANDQTTARLCTNAKADEPKMLRGYVMNMLARIAVLPD